ncbi:MAG: MFS transporter [Sulfurovaceae bacterium]|nr:MFS transporter [Sulfurovaceae bacterium]
MFLTKNQNLNKLSYGFSTLFIGSGVIQIYLVPYFETLGKASMGFNTLLIIYIGIFISNFYASYFIERFGVKTMLIFSASIYILAHLVITIDSELFIYFGAVMIGVVGAILWNSQNIYILGISTATNRGHNSGFFMAIYEIGTTIAMLIIGYVSDIYGYQNAFFVVSFISLISLVFFGKLGKLQEVKNSKKRITIFSALKNSILIRVALLNGFIYFMLIGLGISLLPLHIHLIVQSGLSIGILLGIFFLMPFLISKRAGIYSDIYGRAVVVLVGTLIGILGLLIFHFSTGLVLLTLATLLTAISQSILAPLFIAVQGDISVKENQSIVTTVFIFFKYIGLIVGIGVGAIFGIKFGYIVSIILIGSTLFFNYRLMANMKIVREKILKDIKNEKNNM